MIDPNHNPNPEIPGVTPVPNTEPTPLQPPPDPFKPEPDPFKPEPDPFKPEPGPGPTEQPNQPISIPVPRARSIRPARMSEGPTQPLRALRATPPKSQPTISDDAALDLGPSFSSSFASPFAIAHPRGFRPSRTTAAPTRPMRPLRMMATPTPFPVPDPLPSPEHEPNPLPSDPSPGPQPSPAPDPILSV